MTTNSAELKRELLDGDGENQAVRTFLQLYGQQGVTVLSMRHHLERSDFEGHWPDWVNDPANAGHLTKGGAQDWLRYLFALEGRTAAQGEQSKGDEVLCFECDGKGYMYRETCPTCGGNGVQPELPKHFYACSAEQVSEREKFEATFKSANLSKVSDAWGKDRYENTHIQAMWNGWQARSAISAPERKATDEPDQALLISMACCLNHGFGLDSKEQQERQLYDMRKLYDEMAGNGFYRPENRERYLSMLNDESHTSAADRMRALLNQQGEQTAPA